MFDLRAGTGAPIQGLADVAIGWSAHYAVLDGRRFLLSAYGDGAGTKFYEIGEDGVAQEHMDLVGGTPFEWMEAATNVLA